MRKEDFRQWLDGKIKKKPISDCISRCTTVEYALKVDLDEEYRKDNGQAVIARHTHREGRVQPLDQSNQCRYPGH